MKNKKLYLVTLFMWGIPWAFVGLPFGYEYQVAGLCVQGIGLVLLIWKRKSIWELG